MALQSGLPDDLGPITIGNFDNTEPRQQWVLDTEGYITSLGEPGFVIQASSCTPGAPLLLEQQTLAPQQLWKKYIDGTIESEHCPNMVIQGLGELGVGHLSQRNEGDSDQKWKQHRLGNDDW